MSPPVPPTAPSGTSTRPYLIRALHEWCTDNGFTPYVAVFVGPGVRVPEEYVKNNEIVLNIGFEATTGLAMGNEYVEFKARFGGVSREIIVPVDHVIAIYARENGQGMAFPVPSPSVAATVPTGPEGGEGDRGLRLAATTPGSGNAEGGSEENRGGESTEVSAGEPPDGPAPNRPSLKRIK